MNPIERLQHVDEKPKSYLAASIYNGVVYPCGQIPVDSEGNTPAGIADQTRVVLDNLSAALERAQSSADRILQITVYLADRADFEDYDQAWRGWFGDHPLPPRTTVFVAGFRGAKRIEVTAVAASGAVGVTP